MRILFQGDSITDALRSKDSDLKFGEGYPLLVKAELGFENPGKYEFFNRGIGGNRIVDIYARIKSDIINLKPDVMSILVGVNDVWHDTYDSPNGVDPEKFFKIYSMLIEEVTEALPNIKIMIMEPFVLKGTTDEGYWPTYISEVKIRADKARAVAEKFNLPFISLQEGFDNLCKSAPDLYWVLENVHPTAYGHEYIKREWIKAFKNL